MFNAKIWKSKVKKNIISIETTSFDVFQRIFSSKIPRFDETNIIATHQPENKDYGRMKIIEPLNSFNPNPMINEEIDSVEQTRAENSSVDVNPKNLTDGWEEKKSIENNSSSCVFFLLFRLTDNNIPENRRRFQTYKNEFEVVRLHRHEIEAELRALEQEDEQSTKP